jgi:hypothetical protein
MKTEKELLELLLDNISLMGKFGLCSIAIGLSIQNKISHEELRKIIEYIKQNKPVNLHTIFNNVFYWTKGRKYPRIKWLKKHINNLT